ncbi:hypothetical protein [Streptomyces sp. NPDC053431]|uniref:hypothetical protein n=1 Tax=Streptomyces sp. NPDC053431 TaxID=3365703 RepID=UPI0037D47CAF
MRPPSGGPGLGGPLALLGREDQRTDDTATGQMAIATGRSPGRGRSAGAMTSGLPDLRTGAKPLPAGTPLTALTRKPRTGGTAQLDPVGAEAVVAVLTHGLPAPGGHP